MEYECHADAQYNERNYQGVDVRFKKSLERTILVLRPFPRQSRDSRMEQSLTTVPSVGQKSMNDAKSMEDFDSGALKIRPLP